MSHYESGGLCNYWCPTQAPLNILLRGLKNQQKLVPKIFRE